jgi:hypothetical protein
MLLGIKQWAEQAWMRRNGAEVLHQVRMPVAACSITGMGGN